jgi:N-acetylmuramoyl-L-alanine amidase
LIVAGLLLALQLTAPATMTVRVGERAVKVPVERTASGVSIRADLLGPSLGAKLRVLPNGHHVIALAGAELDVAEHVPFVRVGKDVYPLVDAPVVREGRLHVPLQLVTEVLPRVATGVSFDAERHELSVADSALVARAPASGAAAPAPARAAAPSRRRSRVVVVDAGHGGPDNGMTGPIGGRRKIHEKDITLAVARQLAARLRARGLTVVMTRSKDTLIALSDRGRIANGSEGDLFLSIHVNAANPRWKSPAAARGFETYFLAEAKTADAKRVEEMENESVRFETGVHAPKGDPLAFVINDMAQNEHLRESSDLADHVQRALGRIHPGPSRGVKQANFSVLRSSFMPAVLIEIGFGTNPAEAQFLADPTRQQRLADVIAEATAEYLAGYERRVHPGSR